MPRLSGTLLTLEKHWSLCSDITPTFNKNTPYYSATLRAAFKQHDDFKQKITCRAQAAISQHTREHICGRAQATSLS